MQKTLVNILQFKYKLRVKAVTENVSKFKVARGGNRIPARVIEFSIFLAFYFIYSSGEATPSSRDSSLRNFNPIPQRNE